MTPTGTDASAHIRRDGLDSAGAAGRDCDRPDAALHVRADQSRGLFDCAVRRLHIDAPGRCDDYRHTSGISATARAARASRTTHRYSARGHLRGPLTVTDSNGLAIRRRASSSPSAPARRRPPTSSSRRRRPGSGQRSSSTRVSRLPAPAVGSSAIDGISATARQAAARTGRKVL